MENFNDLPPEYRPYPKSFRRKGGNSFLIARDNKRKYLVVKGKTSDFEGKNLAGGLKLCPLTSLNAGLIRKTSPELSPVPCNQNISFGFGDRLGIATPAHAECAGPYPVFPIFAQQSVRENSRTRRTMQGVVDDAAWGCLESGYQGSWGADADHLKDLIHLREATESGYSMYTIDLSDHIKNPAAMSPDEINNLYEKIPGAPEIDEYFQDKEYRIKDNVYRFTGPEVKKSIVTFVEGLNFTVECYRILKETLTNFDFEVSVDETKFPTTPLDHIFVVEYLRRNGVRFTSIAPRFPGEFEKAIDYIGNPVEFEESFQKHAEICRFFGNYRLSLHSGSDKFSVYPIIKRNCSAFHVKTAGTSYLQAVKTIAATEPSLYRLIHQCGLRNLKKDRQSYSVSLNPAKIPLIEKVSDADLTGLFSRPDNRQLIHITYGSVLTEFRNEIYGCLFRNEAEHYRQVKEHLGKHLELLFGQM
ncbi:MAG: tagaturonate epimerase family protein [Candidatus Omnitrophica bacterium]|nr:tagaturonate epimerase family protein [Candidatus Omnitrophota bacterium]